MASLNLQRFGIPLVANGTPARSVSSGTLLNASGAKYAIKKVLMTDQSITDIGFLVDNVGGTPPNLKLSIQGIDTAGDPDGVIKGAGNSAFGSVAPANASFVVATLGTAYTPASFGEEVFIVAESNGAAFNATDFVQFGRISNIGGRLADEHEDFYNGTTWAKQTTGTILKCVGYKDANQWFGAPLVNAGRTTITANHQHGLSFKLFNGITGTYTIAGFEAYCKFPAGSTCQAFLYDNETGTITQLATTVTKDTDARANPTQDASWHTFIFTSRPTLTCGTRYVVVFSTPGTAANIEYIDFAGSAHMAAMDQGSDWYYVNRSGTGVDFTLTTTRKPLFNLIGVSLTPSGGGGGSDKPDGAFFNRGFN